MGIAWAGEFVDSIDSKAHEGLHYAGHEGGEVVGGRFMQGECLVNREEIIFEDIIVIFHEVKFT
jgi:hypothetical protein